MSTSVEALLESGAARLGISISRPHAERLVEYFQLLAHWNKRINLTSLPVEQPTEHAVERLLIEPLLAIPLIAFSVSSWFDLGSGGGSPAIPLQIAHPMPQLFMVESRERKAAFLREAVRELGLNGAEVLADRIETVATSPTRAESADLVTVRAVKLSAPLFSQLDALLKKGGQAVLFGAAPQMLHTPRALEIQYVEPPLVVLRRAK